MTEQEKINSDVEKRLNNLETKFEMFMQEMREFKTEMRDRDNQRATEIRAMDAKFEGLSKQIQNLTIAAVVGFGAIAVAIGGLVVAALK